MKFMMPNKSYEHSLMKKIIPKKSIEIHLTIPFDRLNDPVEFARLF